MISITIDDRQVLDALRDLQRRAADTRPAMQEIGEYLVETTKRRFAASRGPDGQRWERSRDVTMQRYLSHFGAKNRAARAGAKKPLIGETRSLSTTIDYRLIPGGVEVGSPMQYASTHQFGARQGQFGRTRRGGPIPWGDIPARPFLGLSGDDRVDPARPVAMLLVFGSLATRTPGLPRAGLLACLRLQQPDQILRKPKPGALQLVQTFGDARNQATTFGQQKNAARAKERNAKGAGTTARIRIVDDRPQRRVRQGVAQHRGLSRTEVPGLDARGGGDGMTNGP